MLSYRATALYIRRGFNLIAGETHDLKGSLTWCRTMAKYGVDSLRISSIPWDYLMEWTSTGRLAGKAGGIFDAVASSMNTSYTLSMPADIQWGSCELDGSSCTGMLGDLFYNNSDVSIGPFTALPVYSSLFHQSFPFGSYVFSIVTGMKVAYAVNTFSTFTGIESIVYGLLLILPFAIAALAAINTRWILPKIAQADNNRLSTLFLDLIRLNAQNSSDIRVQSSSNRLLVAGCMLAALFTAIMVSSSIKATMMRRDPTERIKTVADLLKKKHKMSPLTAPKTFITDILEAEESGEVRELYEWIEQSGYVPVAQILSPENVRGILNGTKWTFIDCEVTAVFLAQSYFALPEKHRGYLTCLEQVVFSSPSVWYFHRSLPEAFVTEFNRRTLWVVEAPTKFVFDFKYLRVPAERFARSTSLSGDAVLEALRVAEVIGCFYVLAGGVGGAFITLLLELLVSIIQPSIAVFKEWKINL